MSNIYIRPGVIEGFCGPMMSGKSGLLLKRIDPLRWMNGRFCYICFRPKLDNREINCRSGKEFVKWIKIDEKKPEEILKYVRKEHDLIAIDEIQFFDKKIVKVILELQKNMKNVIFAGLDLTFRGEPFGPMPELISIANEFKKCHAICKKCGEPAYYTQRLIDGIPAHYNSPTVLIELKGKKETYEPRCFKHHEVLGKN